MSKTLADTREEYGKSGLRRSDLSEDPISFFRKWYEEATQEEGIDPNAFVLSTVDAQNKPDSRVLLLKGLEKGAFTFYTNYNSAKGQQMEDNSNVSMLFFWKSLERQVRIRGTVSRISREVAETYFRSRPRGSQLGAWTSDQSESVASRLEIEEKFQKVEEEFLGKDVPMPSYWGGYAVNPVEVEFWQGRASRLHDRFLYTLEGSEWTTQRLAP